MLRYIMYKRNKENNYFIKIKNFYIKANIHFSQLQN